jgi:hypothetical protein
VHIAVEKKIIVLIERAAEENAVLFVRLTDMKEKDRDGQQRLPLSRGAVMESETITPRAEEIGRLESNGQGEREKVQNPKQANQHGSKGGNNKNDPDRPGSRGERLWTSPGIR